jgi:uncharacterized protein
MTRFIPIFPLGIVVFPGEDLNLHIFEPRYKQLVNECFAENKPFGIPTVLKNGLGEIGTLVQIKEVVEVYEDGKLDIKTQGLQVFRILEIVKDVPDKMFSGAIVNFLENDDKRHIIKMRNLVRNIRALHDALKLNKDFKKPDHELISYDVAHHAALSLEEEHELLGLMREDQRLEYLRRHVNKILPLVNEMEQLKERIKMNGHFKDLSSNFNL